MKFDICCHHIRKITVRFLQHQRLMVYACVLFLANGCAREMVTLEPADLPVSLVMEELQEKRSQLSSFRAAGTLRVEGLKQRLSGRAFILSRMPESLRLEVLSFFGQPALYLVSDGNNFLFWEPGSDRAYKGFTSGNTLKSLINFPLEDKKILLLLAGIVPDGNYQDSQLFKVQNSDNLMLQLTDETGQLTQRVWLRTGEFAVTRIQRLRGNNLDLEASFTDFVAIDGSLYPRKVWIKADEVLLTLSYKQFEINEPLQEETFQLILPERIEILPW